VDRSVDIRPSDDHAVRAGLAAYIHDKSRADNVAISTAVAALAQERLRLASSSDSSGAGEVATDPNELGGDQRPDARPTLRRSSRSSLHEFAAKRRVSGSSL
jgi:hypothetical protein